jgi:hypothetical protein
MVVVVAVVLPVVIGAVMFVVNKDVVVFDVVGVVRTLGSFQRGSEQHLIHPAVPQTLKKFMFLL